MVNSHKLNLDQNFLWVKYLKAQLVGKSKERNLFCALISVDFDWEKLLLLDQLERLIYKF